MYWRIRWRCEPDRSVIKKTHRGYRFGLAADYDPMVLDRLIAAIDSPVPRSSRVLGGRGIISHAEIPVTGPVIVKHFRRGGPVRHFTTTRYIKWWKTRPELEFDVLSTASKAGVSVPKPVAHIHRGALIYRGWLVTERVSGHRSLALIDVEDGPPLGPIMDQVVESIMKLIEARICHVDLHPGNVLVDKDLRIYLIDFDKAFRFTGSRQALRDWYIHRWRRAVAKYRLPHVLAELLSAGLLRTVV